MGSTYASSCMTIIPPPHPLDIFHFTSIATITIFCHSVIIDTPRILSCYSRTRRHPIFIYVPIQYLGPSSNWNLSAGSKFLARGICNGSLRDRPKSDSNFIKNLYTNQNLDRPNQIIAGLVAYLVLYKLPQAICPYSLVRSLFVYHVYPLQNLHDVHAAQV